MDDFATVTDLTRRFRIMDPQEAERAKALLHDASVMLYAELARCGVTVSEDDELQADNLLRVCCAMVARALSKSSEPSSETYAFGGNLVATASGELYMTSAERKSIGVSGHGRVGFASMI